MPAEWKSTLNYISMHAGSEDLKTMLSIFKPKYYMPVRGYYNKLVENAKLALDQGYNHSNILVYDNGMVANFENGKLVRNTDALYSSDMNTYYIVDGYGNVVNKIYFVAGIRYLSPVSSTKRLI